MVVLPDVVSVVVELSEDVAVVEELADVVAVVVIGHAISCPGQQVPSPLQPTSQRQKASCPSTTLNLNSVLSHPSISKESGVEQTFAAAVVVVVVGAAQTVENPGQQCFMTAFCITLLVLV